MEHLLPGAGLGVLDGGGEAGGGGLSGVVDGGAVVVEVLVGGRGRGARLERHLLGVVLRWALHVVEGAARGPCWRRGGEARHLRVGFRMHCAIPLRYEVFDTGENEGLLVAESFLFLIFFL